MAAQDVSHFPERTMGQVSHLNFIRLEIPDGGDGGDGGDVYFRSTARLSSLYDLRRAHFFGNNGGYGQVSCGKNFSIKFTKILIKIVNLGQARKW